MKIGAGLSTDPVTMSASEEASLAAKAGLDGRQADLALVFASAHHAPLADEVIEMVHQVASPASLIGCVGEAVVAGSREVEAEPAVSVWLGAFSDRVETFHMQFVTTESGGAFAGWRFGPGVEAGRHRPVHLMIADPFTFPADLLLEHLNQSRPGNLVIGGNASGGTRAGQTILFRDREVLHEGAVGARLPDSVRVRTLVSQGCRPIGDALVVTHARENVVFELAGRPTLERLRETVATLAPPDRELVTHGLHVGRAIDEYKPEHGTGDFLVRGVIGADPDTGAVALGDRLEVGQTLRFHLRDAATADEELRALLQREVGDMRGRPAGALLFTCNGRGTRLFPTPDHDARLVISYLGGVPLAGFFCAGELGPVGGKNFLHGFTASLAIFVEDEPPAGDT
jgi:small ligand-binding sensory domain FIST